MSALNQGHGHVVPRADGVKARCGGPALCSICQREQAPTAEEVAALHAPVAVATSDAERAALMRFYGVDTPDALIAAQANHIEKLQSKLQPAPSFAPQRVREG